MEIDVVLGPQDYGDFLRSARKRLRGGAVRIYYVLGIVVAVVVSVYLNRTLTVLHAFDGMAPALVTLISLGIYVAVVFPVLRIMNRRLLPRSLRESVYPNGNFFSRKRVEISPEGLHVRSQHTDFLQRWAGVGEIEKTDRQLFFYVDRTQAIVVPLRMFASPEDAQACYDLAQQYWQAAGKGEAVHVQPTAE